MLLTSPVSQDRRHFSLDFLSLRPYNEGRKTYNGGKKNG